MTWDRAGLNALEGRRRDEHPATARARSDGWARPGTLRVALLLTLIVVVAVGGPLASGIATGAIAIPHNDDWAFSRIALGLADHGELNLVGWNQMTLVGHLLWAIPFLAVFGTSLETLHAAQAVAAAAGLVSHSSCSAAPFPSDSRCSARCCWRSFRATPCSRRHT